MVIDILVVKVYIDIEFQVYKAPQSLGNYQLEPGINNLPVTYRFQA